MNELKDLKISLFTKSSFKDDRILYCDTKKYVAHNNKFISNNNLVEAYIKNNKNLLETVSDIRNYIYDANNDLNSCAELFNLIEYIGDIKIYSEINCCLREIEQNTKKYKQDKYGYASFEKSIIRLFGLFVNKQYNYIKMLKNRKLISLLENFQPEVVDILENITSRQFKDGFDNEFYDILRKIKYLMKYKKYNMFFIQKKNGKMRKIEAPEPELKFLQSEILNNILYSYDIIKKMPHAHGFIKKRGIYSNAMVHCNASNVVKIDIKDAFGTTYASQFFWNLETLFTTWGALLITAICTNDKFALPQGAPTSPMLLNIALEKVDKENYAFACRRGMYYSRYADDLTFSTNKGSPFSNSKNNVLNIRKAISYACHILAKFKYRHNKEKIVVLSKNKNMDVTGMTVNSSKPTISRKIRRILRARVHNFINGDKNHDRLDQIKGGISFVNMAHKEYADNLNKKLTG